MKRKGMFRNMEIAKSMLLKNCSINEISELTGLSKEDILKLEEK